MNDSTCYHVIPIVKEKTLSFVVMCERSLSQLELWTHARWIYIAFKDGLRTTIGVPFFDNIIQVCFLTGINFIVFSL